MDAPELGEGRKEIAHTRTAMEILSLFPAFDVLMVRLIVQLLISCFCVQRLKPPMPLTYMGRYVMSRTEEGDENAAETSNECEFALCSLAITRLYAVQIKRRYTRNVR